MEHQFHYDKKFYLDNKTGYWISTTAPKIRAHVWVWVYHYGKIENGYHIHHKDENKSNNKIDNIEKILAFNHLSFHMLKEENRKRSRENAEKIRPLTKQWHASDEGRKWHREHAIKCNFGNGEYFLYECQECYMSYKSKIKAANRTRFCSNSCKSKWRRKAKLDDIDKLCPICNITYKSSKYSRSKTCGRKCGSLFKSQIN